MSPVRVIPVDRSAGRSEQEDVRERALRVLRVAGFVTLGVAAVAGIGALVVRDQISRHRREVFSRHPLRRLAALGYLAGRRADVDTVRLLRDYTAWESQSLLRRRAVQILERMERELFREGATTGEVVG